MDLKRNTQIQTWTKTWPSPIFLGERGRRPFCSELFKGLPSGVCRRGKKADRPLGGHLVACLAGGSVEDKAGQVHPGLEDLLLVGKISPQIDSED